MTVREEPFTDEDRAAIESLATAFESYGASPLAPFLIGIVGVAGVAGGFRLAGATTAGAALLIIGGCTLVSGGLFFAVGRNRFRQVMRAMASRLRRNAADAERVVSYEIDAQAGHIVGGDSDAADEEWSGAVVRDRDGTMLFVDVQVTHLFARDADLVQRVPPKLVVRSLPTHEVVRVIADDGAVGEELSVSNEELSRLAAWVRETKEDAPPCREIPPGIIE